MSWLISVGLLIGSIIFKNEMVMIASGLFAIAGSLSIWMNQIAKAIDNEDKKD